MGRQEPEAPSRGTHPKDTQTRRGATERPIRGTEENDGRDPVDITSEDSMVASDPPGWAGSRVGAPRRAARDDASAALGRDTTVKKVDSTRSPQGPMGQTYLVSGKAVSMRLWDEEPGEGAETCRDYETVGYVIEGRAELHLEGQRITLRSGESWLVPRGARHRYRILEPLRAVEATSPPAQAHGRDA
jgi:quercetin dioxygenase-like cupin family protein